MGRRNVYGERLDTGRLGRNGTGKEGCTMKEMFWSVVILAILIHVIDPWNEYFDDRFEHQ